MKGNLDSYFLYTKARQIKIIHKNKQFIRKQLR